MLPFVFLWCVPQVMPVIMGAQKSLAAESVTCVERTLSAQLLRGQKWMLETKCVSTLAHRWCLLSSIIFPQVKLCGEH